MFIENSVTLDQNSVSSQCKLGGGWEEWLNWFRSRQSYWTLVPRTVTRVLRLPNRCSSDSCWPFNQNASDDLTLSGESCNEKEQIESIGARDD